MPKAIPILMYHSISAGGAPLFHDCTLPAERFAEQLDYLVEQRYIPLTITDLRRRLASNADRLPERPVVLTFDDGYADFLTDALPLLVRYGVQATLYVTTGLVGQSSTWMTFERERHRPLLSWRQIASIDATQIVEIGSHSGTHPQLDTLAFEEAAAEIYVSKRDLEGALGHRIESFCYPFGYYNRSLQRMVADAGYSSACATRFMMSSTEDDPWALARIMVPHEMRIDAFSRALEGVGLRVAPAPLLPTTRVRWTLRCAAVRWARRFHLEAAQLEYRLRLVG